MGKRTPHEALILLTDGFDESWLANCLTELRTSNKRTAIVGLRPGPVVGKHGLSIQTDTYLSELKKAAPRLLAIANGRLCATRLMSEPRVYQIIERTIAANGRVGVSLESETFLKKYRLIKANDLQQYIWQRHTDNKAYAQLLVKSLD